MLTGEGGAEAGGAHQEGLATREADQLGRLLLGLLLLLLGAGDQTRCGWAGSCGPGLHKGGTAACAKMNSNHISE